ncbi:MAG: chorismate synthase [Acidobacteriota bacterium]
MSVLSRLRLLDAGESHGPELTAILDGLPAGLPVDVEAVDFELARRQRGFGSGGRMRIEKDRAQLTAGVLAGRTTGAPVALRVANLDWKNWSDRDITPLTVPRPGHADLTSALKHGHDDLRLSLERASARNTATRVAAGALCKQLLGSFGIRIGGHVTSLGSIDLGLSRDEADEDELAARAQRALDDDLCCPVPELHDALHEEIRRTMKAKDTLGGTFEVFALGLPPGLGSHSEWDRRLDGRLAQAMLGIQAMKGVEIGPAFELSTRRGSNAHDDLFVEDDGRLVRKTNRCGGLEGGITNGSPLVVRVAMKPIATTLAPRQSVDLVSGEATETVYERSDFCALPRAVPIGEAMLALVLADALLEKLGGDSLAEMTPRFEALPQSRLSDVSLHGQTWRFLPEATDDPS